MGGCTSWQSWQLDVTSNILPPCHATAARKPSANASYLACAIFLDAMQEQLLVRGLGRGHAGGPYQVGHHHLVPLCYQQLSRPYPLHLPATSPAATA